MVCCSFVAMYASADRHSLSHVFLFICHTYVINERVYFLYVAFHHFQHYVNLALTHLIFTNSTVFCDD